MDALEAMETCLAMRYLKPEPVPEELIRKLVFAATRASNPGNSQGWDFVVLRDRAKKERIGKAVAAAMAPTFGSFDAGGDPIQRRMLAGARHLVEHFADVPLWVLVCGRRIYPPAAPTEAFVWSALYPAAQNLVVAARSLGLGSTFTTFHGLAEAEIRESLGVPADVIMAACIAVGYPDRPFGPVVRKPIDSVLHWDQW